MRTRLCSACAPLLIDLPAPSNAPSTTEIHRLVESEPVKTKSLLHGIVIGALAVALGGCYRIHYDLDGCKFGRTEQCSWIVGNRTSSTSASIKEQNAAWDAIERKCAAETPSSDQIDACNEIAAVLVEKPWPNAFPRAKLGPPNPTRAAKLAASGCSEASESSRSCALLAGLHWVGWGVPRDRALARTYALRSVQARERGARISGTSVRFVPGDELALLEPVLSSFDAGPLRRQLYGDARARVAAGHPEDAVAPLLTLLSLQSVPPSASEEPSRELAEALWETAVTREIAAGRIAVGVGRAVFIDRRFQNNGLLSSPFYQRKVEAQRQADKVLSALPPPTSSGAKALRAALGSWIANGQVTPVAEGTHALRRWEFRTTGNAGSCAWLLAAANAKTTGRPGPPVPVTVDAVFCERQDRRWATTETYMATVQASPGKSGYTVIDRGGASAPCANYGQQVEHGRSGNCSSGSTPQERTIGAEAPTYRQVEATREVRHRQLSWSMGATLRIDATSGPATVERWADVGNMPEQIVHVGGEGAQEFYDSKPYFEDLPAKSLVDQLDSAVSEGRFHRSSTAEPSTNAPFADVEGPLFLYATRPDARDEVLRPLLVHYGLQGWHVRALAQMQKGGISEWLYGLDDAPPR